MVSISFVFIPQSAKKQSISSLTAWGIGLCFLGLTFIFLHLDLLTLQTTFLIINLTVGTVKYKNLTMGTFGTINIL